MGKKKRGQNSSQAAEKSYIPQDINEYEVTDSEGEMSDEERMLLEKVRSNSRLKGKKTSVAIMDIPSSGESDDGEDGFDEDGLVGAEGSDDDAHDMRSDIEGQDSDNDGLPNEKAWGKRKKNYYNTDYVDADYGGFDAEDAEAADMEEQEAMAIQKRLTAELEGADFSLEMLTKGQKTPVKAEVAKEAEAQETIKTDLSQLTSREKLNLLMKEAPELPIIAEEFKSTMANVLERLQKAATFVRRGLVTSELLKAYICSKLNLSLNYSINVVFYFNLRARRIPVNSHPVVRRLLQYRELLEKLKPLEEVAEKQIDELLELEAAGKLAAITQTELAPAVRFTLSDILTLKEKRGKKEKGKKTEEEKEEDDDDVDMSLPKEEEEEEEKEEEVEENDEKRAITWQIAKNKGLTPRRKKEQRNPRVKHRNRFRKAKIRRKGQVREVRNEIQRYGGEMSGIKATVTKSIKFT